MLSETSACKSQCNASLNIRVKVSFFKNGIQQSGLVIEMMIQRNLKGLERMEVLIYEYFSWQ